MKKFNYLSLIITLILLLAVPNNLIASGKTGGKDKGKKPLLRKTAANPSQSLININNATMWVTEEGFHDWVVAAGWNGAFPNGTTVGAIFAEGIVWGGQVSDGSSPVVRVDGNTYGTGCAPITRLYRVRPDYLTGNLNSDAASFNNIPIGSVTEADVKALIEQYQTDWNEWPANQGAPFKDVDNNGSYDPTVDIPGIPGASQTIFIKYNDNLSASNYGSPPIGMEISETYWAYSYSGALGNVIYKKVDMVYKGTPTSAPNSKIDSMYIVQWADPDVGNSTDDFAGCDTSLNLGYAYSSGATDATYDGVGLAPPAVGYDFLQGVSKYTGNPNDSAIFNLQWRKGYKYINRKPMSSYAYFAAGGTWEDPDFNYNGTLEFYNLMRGFRPIPRYPSASPFPIEVADVTADGTFLLTGDPTATPPTGKIDGSVDGPGDRRIMVTNGPITMNLGDTAQVVLALVYGLGDDNLSSIKALKKNDATAQIVFDQLFLLPSLDPPKVQVANLDKKVVLSWGSDAVNLNKIENFADQNYTFEGYEVYQLPSSSSNLSDGILLGTFDLINGITAIYDTVFDANGTIIPMLSSDGKDKGVQRYFIIDNDKVRGTALRNGQEYYFAVVAYAYNPAPLLPFHVLRSPFSVFTTKPQIPDPGVLYSSAVGDTIFTTHTGPSDGSVVALVVDPTRLTGHNYEVTFKVVGGVTMWDLTDVSVSPPELRASDQINQTGNEDYPAVDGFLVKAMGPPLLGVSFTSSGPRWLTGDAANGGELMFGAAFLGPNFWGETTVAPGDLKDVHVDAFAVPSYVDANSNGKYDVGEIYTVDPAKGQMVNLYQTWGAGSWQRSTLIPFKFFDVTSNPPRQLSVVVRDRDANGQWDPDDGVISYNYLFVLDSDYDPTGNNWNPTAGGRDFMDEIIANGGPVLWSFWWIPRGTREQFAADFTMDFVAPKVNTANDKFSFTTPKNSSSDALAKADVEKINVFPNPYYGFHARETAPNNKYVTFSHLPANAIIRIFDISGVLVKTIKHVSTSGQFDSWNLQNDNNLPVASGIYIVYIDMPDLGKTKILKLAIIQEQQILKVY